MQITVICGDKIAAIELPSDCPIENLLALAMADLGVDDHIATAVKLLKEGVDVLGGDRTRSLSDCGLAEGDMLIYSYNPAASASRASAAPSSRTPAASALSDAVSNLSAAFSAAATSRPAAAAASSSSSPSTGGGDLEEQKKRLAALFGQSNFVKEIKKINLQKSPEEEEEEKCRDLFNKMPQARTKTQIYNVCPALVEQYLKNPADYEGFKKLYVAWMTEEKRKIDAMSNQFSAEGQALLMEQIRLENCERLRQQVSENQPELAIPIHMLYIKIVVNGVNTNAFIDSGAQISFISKAFAEKANLEHILDKRFQGIVNGIGGADKMVGRIHSMEIQIGDAKFDAKMDVMNDKFDVLIGLDFMRRHGCCIDLKRNRLSFSETTYAEFLTDAEVAALEKAREKTKDIKNFKVDDEKVAHIMGMGFSKKDAEEALTDSLNDVPDAVRILFAQAEKDAMAISASETAMEH